MKQLFKNSHFDPFTQKFEVLLEQPHDYKQSFWLLHGTLKCSYNHCMITITELQTKMPSMQVKKDTFTFIKELEDVVRDHNIF